MPTDTTSMLTFAAEFPAASREDWRKLVDGVLKGAPFDKKLVSQTYDGLRIEPIYARAAGADVVTGRAAGAPWAISQRIDHADARVANTQALDDLENGATGLALVFCGAIGAHGYGVENVSPATMEQLLDGIVLDAGVRFDLFPAFGGVDPGAAFADIVARRGVDPAQVHVQFNYSPLAMMAMRGYAPGPWSEIAATLAGSVRDLVGRGFRGPFMQADGRIVHDAGGSEAQELAFVLAEAVAYLRALEAGGLPIDQAVASIAFRLSADADQFMTLAKFRALRKLWARVVQACGCAPQTAVVSAETGWRMLTKRDPYVNMLRATLATFAAGLGGATSITVLPHTLAVGLPDAAARRAARNTQIILLEESNLARVTDPAAGSGGMEQLTAQLAAAAWQQFQAIEKEGGLWTVLETGTLAQRVAATAALRASNVARRKDALTGASEFPDIHETPVHTLGVPLIGTAHGGEARIRFEAVKPHRLAEPFEKLRDKADRLAKTKGARPKVFLANLGTAADFTARATFAKNFFEAGGIEAVSNDGFSDMAALAAACSASGAPFACLCSSDAMYARDGVAAAQALAPLGLQQLYLAGRGGDQEAALTAAGVGSFIHAGADVLAVLQAAYGVLEK